MAKSAAERQRDYRERLKSKVAKYLASSRTVPLTPGSHHDIVTLRNDVDALSELFERMDSVESRLAKIEELAERRR